MVIQKVITSNGRHLKKSHQWEKETNKTNKLINLNDETLTHLLAHSLGAIHNYTRKSTTNKNTLTHN